MSRRGGAHADSDNSLNGNGKLNAAVNLKVLFVGDSSVGKSSIIWRYTEGKFVEDIPPTIGTTIREATPMFVGVKSSHIPFNKGVDFKMKHVETGGRRFNLNIWDTAGQEKFRSLMNSYYRGAHGIILVYDVSRPETLKHIKDIWVEEIALYSTNEKAIKLLLGNKVDTERKVPTIEAAKFARDNGFLFAECSSKEGLGIIEAFDVLIHRMTEDPEVWGGSGQQASAGATRLTSTTEEDAQDQRSRCASYYCAI